MSPRCSRCNGRLYPTTDPDYGSCLIHGGQYIGQPVDLDDYKGKRPGMMSVTRSSSSKAKRAEGYMQDG